MAATAANGLATTASVLPLIFFARDSTGSFGGASAVLGGQAIGNALGSPARGRAIDRHGARRVLPLLAVALVVATALLIVAGRAHASLVLLVPMAFALGAMSPSPGVVLRAIWSRVTQGHERSSAFALLTVMHEVTNFT